MPSRVETESEQERLALLANDIKALVSQLNEAMQKAAQDRIKIECQVTGELNFASGRSVFYPVVSVRILAEVQ